MKKRYLNSKVQNILELVLAIQIMMLCCLADFEFKAIPLILGFVVIAGFNTYILYKYGKN